MFQDQFKVAEFNGDIFEAIQWAQNVLEDRKMKFFAKKSHQKAWFLPESVL